MKRQQAKDPQTRIAVRVSEDFKKEFEKLCNEKSINSSALIRNLIQKWMDDQLPRGFHDNDL